MYARRWFLGGTRTNQRSGRETATENRLAGEQSGQREQRSRLAQAAINDPAHHCLCALTDVMVEGHLRRALL